jgi:hypothetical protein
VQELPKPEVLNLLDEVADINQIQEEVSTDDEVQKR